MSREFGERFSHKIVRFEVSECESYEIGFEGRSTDYKRVMWVIIAINATMFVVEASASFVAESMALQADALDFFGDTATYAISLYVIGSSIRVRATAALIKGLGLGVLGLWVLGSAVYRVFVLSQPEPFIMGGIGALAFAANITSAILLMRFREGDANVRSVWLCSRNDAIGNFAVIVAASGVWATSTAWPDLIVAAVIATLFLHSAVAIVRHGRKELQATKKEFSK